MNDTPKPVIAVDAMGGDHGPSVIVAGAVAALTSDSPYHVALYGREDLVQAELAKLDTAGLPLSVVHCTQDIEMGEAPAAAIKGRKDSPIVRGLADMKAGRVRALVSAGSTGAMVAGSLIMLGRLPGVDRPGIGTLIPTISGELLLLDSGATVQCTPEHLLDFARMGRVFARDVLRVRTPRVGQLNIGGEKKKGTELNVAAYRLLDEANIGFIGNVEGNQLMLGPCDVVVTDGFTGNNTLKLVEGFAHFLAGLAKRPDLSDEERAALKPVLQILMRDFSYEVYGGAILLGVAGISIIAHGRSSALAITNAIRFAWRQAEIDLPARLAADQAG